MALPLEHVADRPDWFTHWESNAYLSDMFAPVVGELEVHDLKVIGELPEDLSGMYIRNSPNPRFEPPGRYHWFDGDGMLHAVHLQNGKASYRNRYVQTRSFQHETEQNRAVWGGIMDPVQRGLPGGPLKNASNTDLIAHNGQLLSLWWLGAEPYAVSLPELETLGPWNANGELSCGMSAHPKVCPKTGELIFMDFSFFKPPFMQYGVISPDGAVQFVRPIEIPGPRILHDLAITENYTILMDLPLLWDPEALRHGKRKIAFDARIPARFGILPRHGSNDDVRWFEADPCYIYHIINAWEDGDEITLVACRVQNPMPDNTNYDGTIPRLTFLQLQPFLYTWTFNLKTGAVRESQLDDVASEFPKANAEWMGRKSRYSYNPRFAKTHRLLFDGLIKYDLDSNTSKTFEFGEHHFGSEAVFAPRPGATEEDDGWLVTYLYNAREHTSECIVLHAQDIDAGPVARVQLPRRVPIGFHSTWVDL